MRFDWLKCRSAQLQFNIYWAPGQENFADYFTKNHSAAHHKALRPIYLAPDTTDKQLSMQGCIKILASRLTKKLVTLWPHTKPTSQRSTIATPAQTHKQRIKASMQFKPAGPPAVPNTIVRVPHRSPAAPITIAPTFKSCTPLKDNHIKWLRTPICRYNKQLQTAI